MGSGSCGEGAGGLAKLNEMMTAPGQQGDEQLTAKPATRIKRSDRREDDSDANNCPAVFSTLSYVRE